MKISDIIKSGGVQPTGPAASRTAPPVEKSPYSAALPQDTAELSSKLQESRILDGARLVYDALPDVRADKVELAKKRLAEGYYDRPEVQDQIAAKLAADSEAHPAPALSAEQKDVIRQRLAEGYYNHPAVVNSIAQGLAEDAEG